MTAFIELTRVYKKKGAAKTAALNEQSITIQVSMITSVRASNRLGHPAHRATITLADMRSFDVADKYSVIRKAIGLK